jgi:hypothetical protein
VLCSVGQEGQLRMWDERKASSATAASMPQGAPLFCLGWSPSADMIVAGSENGEVLFFDPRSIQEPLQKWEGHDDSVRRIVALPGLVPPLCRRLRLALHRSVSNVAMPLHRTVSAGCAGLNCGFCVWVGGQATAWLPRRMIVMSLSCRWRPASLSSRPRAKCMLPPSSPSPRQHSLLRPCLWRGGCRKAGAARSSAAFGMLKV